MDRLSKARIMMEVIDADPTPSQIMKVLWELLNAIQDQKPIGFKKDVK